MTEKDRPRFCAAILWLVRKYPVGRDAQGEPTFRKLDLDNLADYFEALTDLSIEAVERGVKWHYGHSEFFPERPASLRKSVEAAPRPPEPRWKPPWSEDHLLIPEVTMQESRRRLQSCFDHLNQRFGTKLKV